MCQETKKFTQGARHKPVSNKKKLKEQTDYQLAKAKEEATVNQMQPNPGGYR